MAATTGRAMRAGVPIGGRGERWRAIVERFAPYVHAVVVRGYGLDTRQAEDAFAEVFLRLWVQVDALGDDDHALRTLVRALARSVAEEHSGSAKELAADEVLNELDEALTVHEALRALEGVERWVLERRLVAGQDDADVARSLGISIEAVAAHAERARHRLRAELRRVSCT